MNTGMHEMGNGLFTHSTNSYLSSFLTEGSRTIEMDETFFTGYRKTILKPEEILLSVEIPFSRKVSKHSFRAMFLNPG